MCNSLENNFAESEILYFLVKGRSTIRRSYVTDTMVYIFISLELSLVVWTVDSKLNNT